jgi:hypothetical protein
MGWPPVTARPLGPKGPEISIIWKENEDFEISTPCTKCVKPQLAWNRQIMTRTTHTK